MVKNKINHSSLFTLLLLGFTWGCGYSLARFAMTHHVSPLGYALWQSIGPGILLLLTDTLIQKKWPLDIKHWRFYAICGLTGIAIPNVNMFFSAQHLPAGILSVVINTVPIFTVFLAIFNKHMVHSKKHIAGAICAFLGITLLNMSQYHFTWSHISPWILSSLATPLLFALTAIYIEKNQDTMKSPLSCASGMMLAASLFLLPITLSTHSLYPLWENPLTKTNLVIFLEIILSSLGYVLFFRLIQTAGAIYYSLTGAVVALTGLFWAKIILSETLSMQKMVACAVIILGVTIASLPKKNHSI